MEHEFYMAIALNEAQKAKELGEIPIGCVIVYKDEVIGRGYNLRMKKNNALAHAEIIAINEACENMGDWRLEECTLYVTVEPCPMCTGAILQARIPKVVYGTENKKAGCVSSIYNMLSDERFNHTAEVISGVMREECANIMKVFFKEFRKKEKAGYIFDFDGTTADSSYLWEKVDRDFFKEHGMEIPPDYGEKISTMSFYEGAVFTKNAYNIEESVEEIMEQWHKGAVHEYERNVELKPYVVEYIRFLKRKSFKVGLATASNPEFYLPVLKKYAITECFDAFADGKLGLPNKEHPDIYLKCAEMMGVEPENCTVYEDIPQGIKSAKAAGMRAIGVYDEKSAGKADAIKAAADGYIMSFKEELDAMTDHRKGKKEK